MLKIRKIILAFFFIQFFSILFIVSSYAEENAAELYQKASSLLSDISHDVHKQINSVITNGWKEDNEELKVILARNKEAIEEFKKATKIAYCDFNFGKPIANDLIAEGPSHLKELRITKLMILYTFASRKLHIVTVSASSELKKNVALNMQEYIEAKLYGRENKLDAALENYLAVIQYVRHLEQQGAYVLLTKVTAWITEISLYTAIEMYLKQNENPNIENCQLLLNTLLSLKADKLKITLENAFEEERSARRNTITKLLDSPDFLPEYFGQNERKQKLEENAGMPHKEKESTKNEPKIKLSKNIRQAIYKEYNKKDGEWYSHLIVAFRENNYSAFKERFEQSGSFKFTPFTWFIYSHPYFIENRLFQWMFPSAIAKLFSRVWMVTMPSYNRLIVRYYNSVSRLNVLIVATAIKLYELEKGKALNSLQELVPGYLEKIPEDPFDNFKPLKYVKKENGWIVYSFGHDKQDDHAAMEIDEEARDLSEAKGDIVFQSF